MPRPLTENVSIATFPLLENNNCSSPFFKNNLMKSMDFDNFYLKGRGIVDVWIGGPRDLSILMRFLSLKSSTFHKILYFCVPKDGVNASAFSCMSSSGDRTFSFARQISQSPFLHQRNDQWRSILLSNFSFYRLVIIEKMLKFSLFFSKKRKLQHFQKTPKTIKISKGISMIKFQHGCVYIGMELVVKRYRRTHGAILK